MQRISSILLKKDSILTCLLITSLSLSLTSCHSTTNIPETNHSPADQKVDNISVVISSKCTPCESGEVILNYKIINHGEENRRFCKFQTPIESQLSSDLVFNVFRGGFLKVKYIGILGKRFPPSEENGDYIVLKPGEEIKGEIDLSESYDFKRGQYKISFNGNPYVNQLPNSNSIKIKVIPSK